jgi:molybdopterin synthase catalytic subunit
MVNRSYPNSDYRHEKEIDLHHSIGVRQPQEKGYRHVLLAEAREASYQACLFDEDFLCVP